MPNPFPGMNPYLEAKSLWRDVHHTFLTYAREMLQPLLRPRYHVRIEERLYVEPVERPIFPDISVIERPRIRPEGEQTGGVAVAVATAVEVTYDEPTAILETTGPIPEGYLEIVDLARGGKVVTVIELLSHANKTVGTDARWQYEQKQRQVLAAGVNLVEIDLLRDGTYVLAPPIDLVKVAVGKDWHYLVSIHKATEPHRFYLYALTVQQRLPRIFIPLAPDDPKVGVLDLQAVIDRCYEAGAYDDVIDYRQEPPPPALGQEVLDWIDKLLKEKGRR
ncbi:MAG: DUF4058 family protein [Armatimonadetes bacterium]|nr:DUF4058 family protein [Armatimonadota bacterium]